MNIPNNSFKLMSIALVSGCMAFTAPASATSDNMFFDSLMGQLETEGEFCQISSSQVGDVWTCVVTANDPAGQGTVTLTQDNTRPGSPPGVKPVVTPGPYAGKLKNVVCTCKKGNKTISSPPTPTNTGRAAFNNCFQSELMLRLADEACEDKPADKPTDKPKPTPAPAGGDDPDK